MLTRTRANGDNDTGIQQMVDVGQGLATIVFYRHGFCLTRIVAGHQVRCTTANQHIQLRCEMLPLQTESEGRGATASPMPEEG